MHKRILLPASSENQILYLSQTTVDDNFKTLLHSHPNLELLFVTKGKGFIQTEASLLAIKKNDLVIINRNAFHNEISESSLTFFAIGIMNIEFYLQNDFSEKIVILPFTNLDSEYINSLYSFMWQEAKTQKKGYLTLLHNLFDTLLIMIQRQRALIISPNNLNPNLSPLTTEIVQIIDNNFNQNLTIEDIAKRFSVSETLIIHQFKKEVGWTIIQYKINKQLEEACNLLKVTNLSISQVASSVGFNSSSYFNKLFKKKHNLSPKEYKKKYYH